MRSVLSLLVFASVTVAADPKKPNVIVIVADDLGYADLGIQGSKDIPTPNIDALANAGARCTSGYVSGPYCSPTRAGLMTGRYQQRFGHEFNPGPNPPVKFGLSLKETTLPDRFKAAGYKTGMVGKWHLGFDPELQPTGRGFETFYGFLGGAHPYFKPGTGQNTIMRGTKSVDQPDYLTDAFNREATAFVREHAKEPYFLYLAFNAVHTPLEASDKYLKRFAHIKDGRRQKYAAMLSAMDDAIGEVLKAVKETGNEDHTLVTFISDNGGPPVNGSSNGVLHGYKATTWEGGIRVPYYVKYPAKIKPGTIYEQPVIQLDLHATTLAAAGIAVPANAKLDGVNILPHLTGAVTEAPHSALYWRFGAQFAIRAGDWKLVKATESGSESAAAARTADAQLYNLKDDIGEKTDLAAKQPEKVKELTALWSKWNTELVPPSWGPMRKKN